MRLTVIAFAAGVILGASAVAEAVGTNSSPANTLPARSMLTMGGIVTGPERRASPLFMGKEIPRPPRQKSAWSPPPSNLPTNYVGASALLFEQGLADPRGCDYREIEVGTGDVWNGDGGVVRTHGWVLPRHGQQRFAICWNGLVYPAASVGTNASLETDVMMLATNGINTWRSTVPEGMAVLPNTSQGVKGCLLLRLGKADLATISWQALENRGLRKTPAPARSPAGGFALTNGIQFPDPDPYLNWAGDWVWSMFDRMLCAHERGDEKLALADARQLATVQPLIEAACAKRGVQRERYWDSRREKEIQPYINFLGQLPEIRADLERRNKEGSRVSVITMGMTNITDQAKRVASLVRDLELVCARQMGQPGGVILPADPIVSGLIGEGDAAVEPLLDCLEHDRRLTRSVGFGRDFRRERHVIAVSSAANVALKSILHAEFSNTAETRAYWEKYKHLAVEERWYAILNDDSARNRWQEAAANIVQAVNIMRYPGGITNEKPWATNAPVPMQGERLRGKTGPTVTELLTRHALEVSTNNGEAYDISACCQMAEYLARWDVRAALPVARVLSRRAATVMKYSGQRLGDFVMRLSLARAQAGDPTAFDEYAEWIVTTTPDQFEQSDMECLEPLRKCPTNATLQATAEKLFGQTNSGWGSLPWKNRFFGATVEAELVEIPGYRALLCRELRKTNVCGTVRFERPNYLHYTLDDLHHGGSFGFSPREQSTATNGATAQIRWCDWIALGLANGKRVAPFDPFASTTDRDAAIEAAITQLKTL